VFLGGVPMAAFEALGVKVKSHDDMVVIEDIFEFRGHGVSNNELWQELAKRFPDWHS